MKHFKITISVLILLCFVFTAFEDDNPDKNNRGQYSLTKEGDYNLEVDSKTMDANNIRTWFRNNGSFNRDPVSDESGFEWPKNSAKFARYASGLWIGARVGSDTLIAMVEYDYEYLPGYIDNSGNPQGSGDPNYRVYRFSLTDTADYGAWRTIAAGQGAYLDSAGNPFRMGAQTMFYSYTDGYPDAHANNAGSTAPLKAQILQTNWCYINVGTQDIQFTEFRVINRSSSIWNEAFLSVWTDDDLGDPSDDAIGCDTSLRLGYTYNFADSDPFYGVNPPAVGTVVLRSPLVFTGNKNDTAKYYNPPGSNKLRVRVGYKYTGVQSFNTYTNGDPGNGDPADYRETYRLLNGFRADGSVWIVPFSGQPTKYTYSGDPAVGTGWLMNSGDDRRFMQSLGPLNMNPGDTQSIIIAQLIASGNNNLNSVTKLKVLSNFAQTLYDNNFQSVVSVNNISTEIPDGFMLRQNYPNPFNPETNIEFEIPVSGLVTLKVYNMLGMEVGELVNEILTPGTFRYNFNAAGLSSGVYFYRLNAGDIIQTKKMILLK